MKHFVGVVVLVALAILVRFVVSQRFGVDIYIRNTYWVIPIREVGFWLLIAIAAGWFLIAAYKFVRSSS